MWFATETEVLEWLARNEWNYGIRADGVALYYTEPEADCLELKFPETPLRVTHLARIASMLGISDESLFYGAVLWITLSQIGSPQLEKSGWKLIEKMRQGFGENRSLQVASGHFFRDDELDDLAAFLVPCFVYAWDAYLIPNARNDFFAYLSHNQYWGVVARTKEAYEGLAIELKELNPKESQGMRERFCRPQKPTPKT